MSRTFPDVRSPIPGEVHQERISLGTTTPQRSSVRHSLVVNCSLRSSRLLQPRHARTSQSKYTFTFLILCEVGANWIRQWTPRAAVRGPGFPNFGKSGKGLASTWRGFRQGQEVLSQTGIYAGRFEKIFISLGKKGDFYMTNFRCTKLCLTNYGKFVEVICHISRTYFIWFGKKFWRRIFIRCWSTTIITSTFLCLNVCLNEHYD